MGEVIRKDAAIADIFRDLERTVLAARAKGGVYATHAEDRLAPLVALTTPLVRQLAEAEAAVLPLAANVAAADHEADLLVAESADRIWNALGRPGRDPGYDLLFPGGNAHYVDGDVADQPARMSLLASLLTTRVHPRLDPALADEIARVVNASAERLDAAVTALRGPRTLAKLLARTASALARTAALELAAYKRLLKADGLSEADIHTVIPDRPRNRHDAKTVAPSA